MSHAYLLPHYRGVITGLSEPSEESYTAHSERIRGGGRKTAEAIRPKKVLSKCTFGISASLNAEEIHEFLCSLCRERKKKTSAIKAAFLGGRSLRNAEEHVREFIIVGTYATCLRNLFLLQNNIAGCSWEHVCGALNRNQR